MVDRGNSRRWKDILGVDVRVKSQAPIDRMTELPIGFQPNLWSVICGRGRESYDSIGNRRFRVLIDIYLPRYVAAKSKTDKSVIVMEIVDTIRDSSVIGGFVRRDRKTGRWCEVGDEIAREKVGQQFRVAISEHDVSKPRKSRKSQASNPHRSPLISASNDLRKTEKPQGGSCIVASAAAAAKAFPNLPIEEQCNQMQLHAKVKKKDTVATAVLSSIGQPYACSQFKPSLDTAVTPDFLTTQSPLAPSPTHRKDSEKKTDLDENLLPHYDGTADGFPSGKREKRASLVVSNCPDDLDSILIEPLPTDISNDLDFESSILSSGLLEYLGCLESHVS